MGVGQLLVGGQDVTTYADLDATTIEFQANRLNGVASLVLRDETGALDGIIRERAEVVVKDDGSRIFGGHVATLTPSLDGGARVYVARAQSYDWLLDVRVIENGLRDGATRYDSDDVAWITTFASDFSLNGSLYVSQLRTAFLPTIDYSGMTLRQALDHLATYTTGAQYWVDAGIDAGTKYVHWTDPRSAQRVSNSDFEAGASNWTLGGDAAIGNDSGPGGTGDAALTLTAAGAGTGSQTVNAVTGSQRYLLWADLRATTNSGARLRFDWQNVSSVSQRIDTITNGTTTGAWTRQRLLVTAPASATKVVITADGQASSTDSRFDNISLVGENAAWGISTSPNGTTTRRFWNWSQPSDSATPVNRVLVRGDGISGWREHASSIGYYGQKYEAVLDDDRVTTSDGIDSRAAWLFAKYAFPAVSGRYQTDASGLQAGTWQVIEIEPFSIEAIQWVATVQARFTGNGTMLYDVTYGSPSDDIASVVVATGSMFGDQEPAIGRVDPVIPGSDTTAPAVPTNVTVTSDTLSLAGEGFVRLVVSVTQPGDADLQGTYAQITRDESAPDTPDWTYASSGFIPSTDDSVAFEGVAGNTDYYVRVWAEDVSGNRSAYAYPAINPHSTVGDSNPPIIPDITQTVPAFKALGVRWTSANAPDLRFYQVRWSSDGFATVLGQENVYATTFVISPLDPGPEGNLTTYSVQVRAVDVSGNVSPARLVTGDNSTDTLTCVGHPFSNDDTVQFDLLTGGTGLDTETPYYVISAATDTFQLSLTQGGGAVDFTSDITSPSRLSWVTVPAGTTMPTAAAYNLYPEAGWSAPVTGTAGRVEAGDVATDAILANNIFAGSVDAGSLSGNTIVVKDTGDFARGIEVRDGSDNVVGEWDATNGIVVRDPSNLARRVTLESGAIKLYDGVGEAPDTAITPDGIDASKVTFGESSGGMNLLPNSSFELSASTVVASTQTHTDWANLPSGGAQTSNDSVSATTSLTIASF